MQMIDELAVNLGIIVQRLHTAEETDGYSLK
jgi:hypothetical protein